MNAMLDELQLQAFLQGIDIPPCPAILLDLDRELNKASPDQRDIARIISKDVALSGRVMQIANSPAFSSGRELNSIIQALNVLGSQQVFNLVVTQLLKVALAGAPEVPMDRFWDTSAQTARLSAELARRLRCVRPDYAYTFGLFHDCGIPLILKRFPLAREALAAANAAVDRSFTEVEEEHLGTNHAAIGYFLARRWRLPEFVVQGIRGHHDYALLTSTDLPEISRAVIAVNVLAEHIIRLDSNGDGEPEWEKAAHGVCTLFGLSLGAVDDLIEDMRDWLA